MKTDNELIAEFMGIHVEIINSVPYVTDEIGSQIEIFNWAKYDTSWDWLMPVVEKIRETGYSNEVQFGISNGYSGDGFSRWSVHIGAEITRWKKNDLGERKVPMESYKIKMETKWWHSEKELLPTVYKACVEFINWYNSQNS
jgi:hypothetical protein